MPDLRSFIFARHDKYGYLLLQAEKLRKGQHYQVPGGRVNNEELGSYSLAEAVLRAAARELFEETGIDVRHNLERLVPAMYDPRVTSIKGRYFFHLQLLESDSLIDPKASLPITGESFRIMLSPEHKAFKFEPNPFAAAKELELHSGGHVAWMLRALMQEETEGK